MAAVICFVLVERPASGQPKPRHPVTRVLPEKTGKIIGATTGVRLLEATKLRTSADDNISDRAN